MRKHLLTAKKCVSTAQAYSSKILIFYSTARRNNVKGSKVIFLFINIKKFLNKNTYISVVEK
jgi:hypothetical protein